MLPCLIQVLAFEAGRKHKIRVNTISAGILAIPNKLNLEHERNCSDLLHLCNPKIIAI